jgi:SNF2 family DNA or RNA helicase
MTGSPIQNNLQEMWALFDYACEGRLLGDSATFKSQVRDTRERERNQRRRERRESKKKIQRQRDQERKRQGEREPRK